MANPITLKIAGVEYLDYKSASVTYGIESFARAFTFEFSDKWLRTMILDLPFAEGDPCEVLVHGTTVLDGYIDDIPISYDATSHSISVTGRSWNAHMVDCSAVHKGGSWRNVKLADLAKDLADPFGVSVMVDPWAVADSLEPFPKWAIEDEETAYGCLQRAAEMRGLFLMSDAGRNIVITKASPVMHPAVLRFGTNILRASRMGRFSERYSYYLVKSQRAGKDTFFGEEVAGTFFRVNDPQVVAYRPLIIVSDGQGQKNELKTRASWEMNVRAGRSRRISYDVLGHRSPVGKVWPVNELIVVDDPFLDSKEGLLIASVMLRYDDGGEVASMELCRPEAFDVLQPPQKKSKKKGFMSWS